MPVSGDTPKWKEKPRNTRVISQTRLNLVGHVVLASMTSEMGIGFLS